MFKLLYIMLLYLIELSYASSLILIKVDKKLLQGIAGLPGNSGIPGQQSIPVKSIF